MLQKSKTWANDIDRALSAVHDLNSLEGKSVLITGAGGLICSAVADMLIRYNWTHDKKIRVFLAGRSEQRLLNRFGKDLDEETVKFVHYDAAASDVDLPAGIDYIIHGASNAFPKRIMEEPVETMASNFSGLMNLLNYAKENHSERVLYISSSEIYGQKENNEPYRENEYGFIDLLNPRNSYPVSKRAAETLCAAYALEYGTDSVIVRPGHIYGPTATSGDNRVSSVWAYDAANGKDIVMKSDGSQIRSYCYCADCASAILTVLLKGESTQAYNISNPEAIISIRQMAEILTAYAGTVLHKEFSDENEKKSFNPMNNSSLNSDRLEELGWTGLFCAEEGFAHTVEIIKELRITAGHSM